MLNDTRIVPKETEEALPALKSLTLHEARGLAGRLKSIIDQTSIKLGANKYVRVEGWKSIASEDGCCPGIESIEWIKPEDGRPGGVRAKAILKRMSDGMVITTAYGFVGDDERTWKGRPMYAREGMAQTRALARACRHRYDYVVILMGGEYKTTPAEEVTDTKQVTVLGTVKSAKTFTETEGKYAKYVGITFIKILPAAFGGEARAEVTFYTRDGRLGAELVTLAGQDVELQVQPREKMGEVLAWQLLEPEEPEAPEME